MLTEARPGNRKALRKPRGPRLPCTLACTCSLSRRCCCSILRRLTAQGKIYKQTPGCDCICPWNTPYKLMRLHLRSLTHTCSLSTRRFLVSRSYSTGVNCSFSPLSHFCTFLPRMPRNLTHLMLLYTQSRTCSQSAGSSPRQNLYRQGRPYSALPHWYFCSSPPHTICTFAPFRQACTFRPSTPCNSVVQYRV